MLGQGIFEMRIPVRVYELDTQGHLNSAVFLQYAEHARWEHLSCRPPGSALRRCSEVVSDPSSWSPPSSGLPRFLPAMP